MSISCLAAALTLVACTHAPRKSADWPTLVPRPGEPLAAVMVRCAKCAPLPAESPAPVKPAEALRTLPADADARLTAVETALKPIEAKLPAQAGETRRALAAAKGRGEADDASVAAEVQRTRLEALTLALPDLQDRLDTLSAEVKGIDGSEAIAARIATLSARIAAAEAAGRL